MNPTCAKLTKKDIAFIRGRMDVKGLSDEAINEEVSLYLSNADNKMDLDTLLNNYLHLLNPVFREAQKKRQERQAQKVRPSGKVSIEGVPVRFVGKEWSDKSAVSRPDVLHIFTENLQARNGNPHITPFIIEGVRALPKDDAQRHAFLHPSSRTSAVVRTDSNYDYNENVLPITVKINGWKGNNFTNDDEDQLQGEQDDLNEQLWLQDIENIINAAKSGKYKSIEMPSELAGPRARLRESSADKLCQLLGEKLGIYAYPEKLEPASNQSWEGEWYKIVLNKEKQKKEQARECIGWGTKALTSKPTWEVFGKYLPENARFTDGTSLKDVNKNFEDIDISGMSIEEVYQNVIKQSKQNEAPSKSSIISNPNGSDKEKEDFSYNEAYLPLYKLWYKQLKQSEKDELRDQINEKMIIYDTPTRVNPARAIADIVGIKNIKQSKVMRKRIEAMESLNAERPIESFTQMGTDDRDILEKVYPDVTVRHARIAHLERMFSLTLDSIIAEAVKEMRNIVENLGDTEEGAFAVDFMDNMNKGNEAQQRIYALEHLHLIAQYYDMGENSMLTLPNGAPANNSVELVLNSIQQFMLNIISDDEDTRNQILQSILPRVTDDGDILPASKNFLAESFYQRAIDYGFIDDHAKLVTEAKTQLNTLARKYAEMLQEDVFKALVKEVSFNLEFNENIRILNIMNSSKNGKSFDELENGELDEDRVDANKEGYMVKYKLLPPPKTLSVRMKRLLGSMPMVRNYKGNKIFVYDDLGQKVTVDALTAYHIMLDEFATMTSPKDFKECFKKLVEKYPQFDALAPYIIPDSRSEYAALFDKELSEELRDDIMREIYRAARKSRVLYGMTNSKGHLVRLNRDVKTATFLEMLRAAYQGHLIVGENSLYNGDGTCNEANVNKLYALTSNTKKAPKGLDRDGIAEFNYKNAPLYWVEQVFKKQPSYGTVQNMIRAVEVLRGEAVDHKRISFEAILNNMGIRTADMDLDFVVPDIVADDVRVQTIYRLYGENLTDDEMAEALETFDDSKMTIADFEKCVPSSFMSNMVTFIQHVRDITSPKSGFHGDDDLVSKFQKRFCAIGSMLQIASDGYNSSSFRHGDKIRQTHAAPDFIQNLVYSINSEDANKAQEFIDENFKRFDFYYKKSKNNPEKGTWMNTWLEDWETNPTIRKGLEFINMLSLGGSEKQHLVGKVSKNDLLLNTIKMFFQGSRYKSQNLELAWYRCPLFSDVDALVFLRGKRYKGEHYKEEIITNLRKVLEQELDRYAHLSNLGKDSLDIDFYNKNGLKSQFFPYLNAKANPSDPDSPTMFQLLSMTIQDKSEELEQNPAEFVEWKHALLEDEISQHIEEQCANFLKSFELADKSKLYHELIELQTIDEEKDSEEEDEKEEEEEPTYENLNDSESEALNLLLTEFYYNDFFAQSQIIQLLGGDLAYYKNFRDFIKRNKQCYACGERLWSMDTYGEPIKERCLYMEDLEMMSSSWAMIDTLLRADPSMSTFEKDMLRGSINAFKNICSTDGQSFRTMKSFRKIFKAMGGTWTDEMERAYNEILNWQQTPHKAGDPSLESYLQVLWHPIKPFVFSYEAKEVVDKNGNTRIEKVPVQHKNSEYMLNAIYSMLNIAMNQSPELLAIHQFMEDNDIDVAHFHSVVKEGFFNGVDINYDYDAFPEMLRKSNIVRNTKEEESLPDGIVPSDALLLPTSGITTFKQYKDALDKALINKEITQEEYNNELKRFRHKAPKLKSAQSIRHSSAYKALQKQAGLKDKNGEVKLNEDGRTTNLHPDFIHVIKMEDYMIVQPSADHLTDEDALYGSQLRNIIPADLEETFTMQLTVGFGKNAKTVTLNREQAVKHYNRLLVDNYLDAFQSISKDFKDIYTLQSKLKDQMRGNPKYGEDVQKAIEIDNSDPKHPTFTLPFTSPTLTNKIEELLLSTFKNEIQKQRIKGGNAVLVSNYGLSDELHIDWKEVDAVDADGNPIFEPNEYGEMVQAKKKAINYIECYLPYTMRDQLADFTILKTDNKGNSWYELDIEEAKRVLGENSPILEVIGYRIPTEDKYSIMPLRIKGFMPSISGTAIMLPSDIVTMSGTDFDIDKLFIMIRAIRRETYKSELREAYADWLDTNQAREDDIIATLISSQEAINEENESQTEEGKEGHEDVVLEILKALQEETGNYKDSKTLKKLRRKKDANIGLTDREIAYFANKSPLFAQFLEERGHEFIIKKDGKPTPFYRIKYPKTRYDENGEIDLDNMSLFANKEERNNMLMDMIWKTLTSPEGSKLSMIPGDFENVRKASRMQRILHDKQALLKFMEIYKEDIKQKGVYLTMKDIMAQPKGRQVLEDLYDKYASVQSPMDIMAWTENHRNLMDGNDLIGMFAVNSSNHYKFQFLNLKLNTGYRFRVLDERGFNKKDAYRESYLISDVDGIYSPISHMRIGRICAELQAASPDNGKDPCLGDLNANDTTVSRIGFLARVGFDTMSIGILNNCAELVSLGHSLKTTVSNIPTIFEVDIPRITELYSKVMAYGVNVEQVGDALIHKIGDEPISQEDTIYLIEFAKWMDNINKAADMLSAVSCISRSDSSNGAMGISSAEVIQQRLKASDFIRDAKDPSSPILGLDALIDVDLDINDYTDEKGEINKKGFKFRAYRNKIMNSPVPRMQAVYSLGHKSARTLATPWIPALSESVYQAVLMLREEVKSPLTYKSNTATLKAFNQELVMYMLSGHPYFKENFKNKKGDEVDFMRVRNYYVHDFPMHYKAIIEAKKPNGSYVHPLLQKLPIFKMMTNKDEKGIRFENIIKVQELTRKRYVESLNALLDYSNEKDREEEKQIHELALDLFMYAFFDNGLQFRHNSYGLFFSTRYLNQIPGYVNSLKEVSTDIARDSTYAANFVYQFILNHPELIYRPRANEINTKNIKAGYITVNEKNNLTVGDSKNPGVNPKTVEFIKYKGKVYHLTEPGKYEVMTIPPKGTMFYDATKDYDEIAYSQLQGKGSVVSIKDNPFNKASNSSLDRDVQVTDINPLHREVEASEPIFLDREIKTSEPTSLNRDIPDITDPGNTLERNVGTEGGPVEGTLERDIPDYLITAEKDAELERRYRSSKDLEAPEPSGTESSSWGGYNADIEVRARKIDDFIKDANLEGPIPKSPIEESKINPEDLKESSPLKDFPRSSETKFCNIPDNIPD